MSNPLQNPIFKDRNKARQYLEATLWPDGPVCGHCGVINEATPIKGRDGLYQCNACRKQFTVTVGTVFERSHIPLDKWLLATFLLCASKKGISAHQMHRMLDITYKSAWFMMHRLREAMVHSNPDPMGGDGKTVEADETYWGGARKGKNRKGKQFGIADKMKVVALVERNGRARSFHVEKVNMKTVAPILRTNVDRKSKLMTDEAKHYVRVGKEYSGHEAVEHNAEEWVRGEAHTNTIEGFFGIFKRGMKGTYQHCGEQHLKRYLAEFDFRYNNRIALGVDDSARTDTALKGIVGKRLTYRRTDQAANA